MKSRKPKDIIGESVTAKLKIISGLVELKKWNAVYGYNSTTLERDNLRLARLLEAVLITFGYEAAIKGTESNLRFGLQERHSVKPKTRNKQTTHTSKSR